MKKFSIFFLFLTLIIGIYFRLWQIDSVPPSASLDEASIGWNAYSILETGKDEYGYKFPILLRAYDDYRPALYVYTVIPFVKIIGLNVLAVRLPSVILSIITIFGVYFLIKELFKRVKDDKLISKFNPEHLALITSFLFAISPWHIYISRLGHEANLAFFAFIFGLLFFLKRNIYLSSFFFIISFVSYQTEKIFIPLILIIIFFLYHKEIFRIKKKLLLILIFSLIILFPFLKATFSPNALVRFSGTNVFNNDSKFIEQSLFLKEAVERKDFTGIVLFNRRIVPFQILTESYLSHFDLTWLFSNSGSDSHKVPNMGLIHIWLLPFVLLGIYLLIRYNFNNKTKLLIFFWFLFAPLAASLGTGYPHALRSLVYLPTWQIFGALGLLHSYHSIKNRVIRNASFTFLFILVTLSLLYFEKQYFYVFPKMQSSLFQYALSEAVPYASEIEKKYERVVFSNKMGLAQSYMFYLFYNKYDPRTYHNQGGTISGGYNSKHNIGKYEFRSVDYGTEPRKILFFVDVGDKITNAYSKDIIKTFYNLDGSPAIYMLEKK